MAASQVESSQVCLTDKHSRKFYNMCLSCARLLTILLLLQAICPFFHRCKTNPHDMERSGRLKCSRVFICGGDGYVRVGEIYRKQISNSSQRQRSKVGKQQNLIWSFSFESFWCEHNKALEWVSWQREKPSSADCAYSESALCNWNGESQWILMVRYWVYVGRTWIDNCNWILIPRILAKGVLPKSQFYEILTVINGYTTQEIS